MEVFIYVPAKPISVNSTYYANKRHGMRPEAKEFYQTVFKSIKHKASEFEKLRNHFDPKKHVYQMFIETMAPESYFYTKDGIMTSKIADISNVEKSIVDAIMLKKFFNESGNLNTDDRFLQHMESKKTPTKTYWGINITIKIVNKPIAEID